jgi:hypothetical protein
MKEETMLNRCMAAVLAALVLAAAPPASAADCTGRRLRTNGEPGPTVMFSIIPKDECELKMLDDETLGRSDPRYMKDISIVVHHLFYAAYAGDMPEVRRLLALFRRLDAQHSDPNKPEYLIPITDVPADTIEVLACHGHPALAAQLVETYPVGEQKFARKRITQCAERNRR